MSSGVHGAIVLYCTAIRVHKPKTSVWRRESAETIVLLEAILEGLSDEKSGAKRDLCANAAREFLVWSAKHIPMPKGREVGSSSNKASSNLNAASLLRRLFERLAHPQAYQRCESLAFCRTCCI